MSFDAHIDDFTIKIDTTNEMGGNNAGASPKKLLLAGLAGCSGMDVVTILKKMQQPLSWFNIKVDAIVANDHPKIYTNIRIEYQFKQSDGLDCEKVSRAVQLSQDTYCGVAAMLRKSSDLEFSIVYL